jgi:DNA processing protein
MDSAELLALAVTAASFLRPRERLVLLVACRLDPEVFARLRHDELVGILGRWVHSRSFRPEELLERAQRELGRLTRGEFLCTFYWDSDFPPLLRRIYDPPPLLYYRGRLPEWSQPFVAIVGTRHPTGAARKAAHSLGLELARAGVGTVSGLARGIDAEVHRGTLDGGGVTVAVLGTGIDQIFPTSSRGVARRVLSRGGVLLSDYLPGTPPRAHNFPARNRIISGLVRKVVVVQAPRRSGALITGDYALEQNRELVVHAEGLLGVPGAGSRELAEQGAEVVRCAGDVLRDFPRGRASGRRRRPPAVASPRLPADSREVGRELASQLELELAGTALAGRVGVQYGPVFGRGVDGQPE